MKIIVFITILVLLFGNGFTQNKFLRKPNKTDQPDRRNVRGPQNDQKPLLDQPNLGEQVLPERENIAELGNLDLQDVAIPEEAEQAIVEQDVNIGVENQEQLDVAIHEEAEQVIVEQGQGIEVDNNEQLNVSLENGDLELHDNDVVLIKLNELDQYYALQIEELNLEHQGQIPVEILESLDREYQANALSLVQQLEIVDRELGENGRQKPSIELEDRENLILQEDLLFLEKLERLSVQYEGNIPEEILIQAEKEHHQLIFALSQQQQDGLEFQELEEVQIREKELALIVEQDKQFQEELVIIDREFEAEILGLEQKYEGQIPDEILIEVEERHQALVLEHLEIRDRREGERRERRRDQQFGFIEKLQHFDRFGNFDGDVIVLPGLEENQEQIVLTLSKEQVAEVQEDFIFELQKQNSRDLEFQPVLKIKNEGLRGIFEFCRGNPDNERCASARYDEQSGEIVSFLLNDFVEVFYVENL